MVEKRTANARSGCERSQYEIFFSVRGLVKYIRMNSLHLLKEHPRQPVKQSRIVTNHRFEIVSNAATNA
jgi:hypothetical protein